MNNTRLFALLGGLTIAAILLLSYLLWPTTAGPPGKWGHPSDGGGFKWGDRAK